MTTEKTQRYIITADQSGSTPSIKPFLYFPFEYKVNSFCANWTESDVNDFFSPIPFLLSTAIFSIAGPLILNYLGFSIKSIFYELVIGLLFSSCLIRGNFLSHDTYQVCINYVRANNLRINQQSSIAKKGQNRYPNITNFNETIGKHDKTL
ncbi:MAG: hypothetical protein ACON5A_04415 [Candidatus Comchoanobacterales bacterium]